MKKYRKISKDRKIDIAAIATLVVVFGVIFYFMFFATGCVPQKQVTKLKAQFNQKTSMIDSMQLKIKNYELKVFDFSKQITDLQTSRDSLSVKYSLVQQTEKTELENYLTTLWNIDYYENGNIKSESGSTAIKTKDASSKTQITENLELKKQLDIANQRIEMKDSTISNMKWENTELTKLNKDLKSLSENLVEQINKQVGLNWWQKFFAWSGAAGWLVFVLWMVWKFFVKK